jgi:tetratricopeptide (TPR) repeat protein
MIVRDNARTLAACLESIRRWVDELIIVDTGSTDETPQIVQRYGGKLYHFAWCDDFSAARNESLKHASGEWVFWMDSDDTITPECGRGLRELAYRDTDPSILGYVMQVHCPGDGEDGRFDVTAVDHVKLFRNRPDLRFDGRIHEQILGAIRLAGGEVAWSDYYVVHSGSDHSTEGQNRKRQRDLRLLNLELRERPNHPFTLFNLGMTYADCERFEEAVDFLARSIANSDPGESHLRKAYALLMFAQMRLKRLDEARETCRIGRVLFPDDIELRFRQGVLLHELRCLSEAARAYRDVLTRPDGRHFTSVDRGLGGFKARQNLAVVLGEMGRHDLAEREWRHIIAEVPLYRDGWRGLGETLVKIGQVESALELAQRMEAQRGLSGEADLLRGKVAQACGDYAEAKRLFESALSARPDDPDTLRVLGQVLFDSEQFFDAERVLSHLARVQPADASTHFNLGTVYLILKRYEESVRVYHTSLVHRPESAPTLLHLGYALKGLGRISEAVAAWTEALHIDPACEPAKDELRKLGRLGNG